MRALLDWIDRTVGRVYYRVVGTLCILASLALAVNAFVLFRSGRWEGAIPLLGMLLFGVLAWYCWRPGRRMSDTSDW